MRPAEAQIREPSLLKHSEGPLDKVRQGARSPPRRRGVLQKVTNFSKVVKDAALDSGYQESHRISAFSGSSQAGAQQAY